MLSTYQLTSAKRRFERTAQEVEREIGKLYDPDGKPYYRDEEHQRRKDALLTALHNEYQDLSDKLSEAYREADSLRDQLDDPDLAAFLSESELEEAARRREFIKEDAARLPLAELAKRAQRARESGDRVTMYLLSRYTGMRIDDLQESARKNPDEAKRRRMLEGVHDLQEEIRAINEALIPDKLHKDIEQADELSKLSLEIRRDAAQRVKALDGTQELLEQQIRQRINF